MNQVWSTKIIQFTIRINSKYLYLKIVFIPLKAYFRNLSTYLDTYLLNSLDKYFEDLGIGENYGQRLSENKTLPKKIYGDESKHTSSIFKNTNTQITKCYGASNERCD